MSARILLLDIETAPLLMAAWRQWEANAVWVERDTHILMYAYQWLDEGPVKSVTLADFPGYSKNIHCDKKLCLSLRELLSEADVVVAHNGDRFDLPLIAGRFFLNRVTPASPFKTVDTLKIARGMKLDSNKLDNIGRMTGAGRKIANTGSALWRAATYGDRKAITTMRRYCEQDVRLLARVYELIRPYSKTHVDLTMYGDRPGCPVCQSTNVKKQGWKILRTKKKQQWQCLADGCGKWF